MNKKEYALKTLSFLEWALLFLLLSLFVYLGIALFKDVASRRLENYRRSLCVSNLHQIYQALALYREEWQGFLPPVDHRPDNWMVEGKTLFPEYLQDLSIFGCPSDKGFDRLTSFRSVSPGHPYDPECLTAESYLYPGWMVTNDEELIALLGAAKVLWETESSYSAEAGSWRYGSTLEVGFVDSRGTSGPKLLYRLSSEAMDIIATKEDIAPEALRGSIPIMWEHQDSLAETHHRPQGSHVLYYDGHVEFILSPTVPVSDRSILTKDFPLSERAIVSFSPLKPKALNTCLGQ